MYVISKRFSFSASHLLPLVPAEHPCGRLHGHNYEVEIVLMRSNLERGFVVDYNDLKAFKVYIDDHLDHRHLNDVLDNPTAELLAEHLYEWAKKLWPPLAEMRVSETPKTWAVYRR